MGGPPLAASGHTVNTNHSAALTSDFASPGHPSSRCGVSAIGAKSGQRRKCGREWASRTAVRARVEHRPRPRLPLPAASSRGASALRRAGPLSSRYAPSAAAASSTTRRMSRPTAVAMDHSRQCVNRPSVCHDRAASPLTQSFEPNRDAGGVVGLICGLVRARSAASASG